MPYINELGIETYKIWIYKIRSINISTNLENFIKAIDLIENGRKLLDEKITKLPTRPQKEDVNTPIEIRAQNEKIKLTLRQISGSIKTYETIRNKTIKGEKILDLINTERLKFLLDQERNENLEKISMRLFDTPYEQNKDNFVEFPIDLYLNENLNFKIMNLPIFNRVYIKQKIK
jgi:hypothetical protein